MLRLCRLMVALGFSGAILASGNAYAAIQAVSATLVAETVSNGVIDAGEGVAMSLCIRNPDATPTPYLTGFLNGATGASGTQIYGSLAPNETACRTYTFIIPSAACGFVNGLQLVLNGTPGGTSASAFFEFPVGPPGLVENFDTIPPPALPSGWTGVLATGPVAVAPWKTVVDPAFPELNNAFAPAPNTIADNQLTTRTFTVPAGASKLTFFHDFSFETNFDGGVLEIAINSLPFTDILAAGGSLAAGSYTGVISSNFQNPLAGRQAWTGTLSGTMVINMPPAAAGQQVRLRFRAGTDFSVGAGGWTIHDMSVIGTGCATVPTNIPWGFQGVANGNVVTFSWRAPLNALTTGFILEASVDAGLTFPFSFPTGTLTSFTVTGPSIPVVARVRALLSGGGTSPPSNTAAVAIGSAGAPGRITNLLSSVDGSSLTLAWSLPLTGGTISTVMLEAGSAPGTSNLATLPLGPGATGFAAGGLPGGTYYLRMRAAGPSMLGQASNEVKVTVPGVCTPPATPILFRAVKAGAAVTISWELPPLGTSAPSDVVLEAGNAPGASNLGTVVMATKSLTAPLPPGNYFIRMFARNSCGSSAKTTEASLTIP